MRWLTRAVLTSAVLVTMRSWSLPSKVSTAMPTLVCRIVLLIGMFLMFLGAAELAAAQQGNLNTLLNQFNEYYKAGDYPAALAEAQKFEAAAKSRFGTAHVNYGIALNNLAIVYSSQGKLADAEAYYQRALAIYERALRRDDPKVARTLNNLAVVYRNQSKYIKAEETYQRVLAIRENVLGRDHPDVANTLNGLAVVYWSEGKYAEAEAYANQVVAARRRTSGKDDPDTLWMAGHVILLFGGDHAGAASAFDRALVLNPNSAHAWMARGFLSYCHCASCRAIGLRST